MTGQYLLHSGNIGNISTAYRSDYYDETESNHQGKKDGSLPSDIGVHLTSQINFRSTTIPFSNTFLES